MIFSNFPKYWFIKKTKSITTEESNFTSSILESEYLIRELYSLDWIIDDHYKKEILDKIKILILESLKFNVNDFDNTIVSFIQEKNATLNKIRKSGRSIFYLEDINDIKLLFNKKNTQHYTFYKLVRKLCTKSNFNLVKKSKEATYLFVYELLNFLTSGLDIPIYEPETQDNLLKVSIAKRYIKIKRKCIIIELAKAISEDN